MSTEITLPLWAILSLILLGALVLANWMVNMVLDRFVIDEYDGVDD